MTNTDPKPNSPAKESCTDEESWDALYARIRFLALQRSEAMARDAFEEEDAFDRGARSLRALMGAAEISRRMKCEDDKEKDLNDLRPDKPVSDERIEKVYRTIERSVAELQNGKAQTADHCGSDAQRLSGAGGEVVEDQCS